MKLRKLIAAVAGLGLLCAPAVADAHGWHGGYHSHGSNFGTGLAVGAGLGILGGAAIAHDHDRYYYHHDYRWYHSQPYYDAPYYYSRPDCPYGSYPAESPYRPGTWVCVYS